MSLDKVWVFAEAYDGKVKTITLEILAKAREIADTVECFYGGAGDDVATELGAHGAETVYATGELGDQLVGPPVAAALAAKFEADEAPDLVMFGTTYDGRDVAGRLSAKVGVPVITNVVDVVGEDADDVAGVEPVFGGTTDVTTKFTGERPRILLVRPKSFAAEPSGGGEADVEDLEVPDLGATGAATVLERHVEEASGPKLEEAAIVVSGGRGLGDKDKYELIEQLAKLLKAAPGASRAIVDAGWVPYSYQVGQTGKVVKPSVYIAAGISGATQHMVGMKGSKYIIAINKDKEAPIFSIADLGIVGDVHKVLPKLIETLQSR
ncbi:MAG: electron transfer flavoprotein subunit alpha/FixB family protein [Acidimicrobiia bacterium]|nr:electron transfer flavoprotein subunit alpha/FixB family protein [Acidimicrobiia bacterium]